MSLAKREWLCYLIVAYRVRHASSRAEMRIAMQTMLFPTLLLRGDAMLVVCGAHLSIRRRESPAKDSLLFLKIFKKVLTIDA